MQQSDLPDHKDDHCAAVGEGVRDLVRAADGTAGLDVLLLLAQDPLVCDTAAGFSARLHRPVVDIRHSLESLRANGVLESSSGPSGRDDASYWLPTDPDVFATLGRLWQAYSTTPTQRREVLALVATSVSVAD